VQDVKMCGEGDTDLHGLLTPQYIEKCGHHQPVANLPPGKETLTSINGRLGEPKRRF